MLSLPLLIRRQVSRELLAHGRDWRSVFNASFFFVLVCVFFPLTMPPDVKLLRSMAPGLIWIAALLSLFLSAERLFHPDDEEGLIEQWMVSGYPLSLFVWSKLGVHWLLHMLPMVLICPFFMLLFQLSFAEVWVVIGSILCGTPTILTLCALASALGMRLKQKSVLMGLVVFPLTVPVMILASSCIGLAMDGMPVRGTLALLLAMTFMAVGLLPFAIAAILKTE